MIVTRKRHIPWTWILFAQVPFATWMFAIQLNGTAFTYSFNKFIDNPALLMFVLSIATFPGLVIGPVLNYMSDRIWTKWGRRKPFIILPYLLQGLSLALFPLAPNFYTLTACLWLYQIVGAFGPGIWALPFEITPPPQRGLGSALHSALFWVALLVYYSVMIGRFDDQYFMGPISSLINLNGEQMMYWIAAPLMIVTAFLVGLGVKEILPPSRQTMRDEKTGKWITPWTFIIQFFKDVFDKQWLVLYVLMFSSAIYGVGLGSLTPLLYSEQWGYTKQEFGMNVAIGAAIMLPFTFMTGWFIDKFDKMKVYQITLLIPILVNIAYVIFIQFFLPDHRPELWHIVLFGEIGAIVGNIGSIVTYPLYMEYVPRNKIGTVNAGMGLVSGIFTIITANLAGWWVTGYSETFCPRAGSLVQIVTTDVHTAGSLRGKLAESDKFSSLADKLNIEPYFYPGLGGKESRQWVIRDFDPETAAMGKSRKQLDNKRSALQTAIDKAEGSKKTVPEEKVVKVAELKTQIASIDSTLNLRAQAFNTKIRSALGDALVPEGEQFKRAQWGHAAIVQIGSSRKVGASEVRSLDVVLKRVDPSVVEVLHAQSLNGTGEIRTGGAQGISIAFRVPDTTTAPDLDRLISAIDSVGRMSASGIKDKKERERIQDAIDLSQKLKNGSDAVTGFAPVFTLDVNTVETTTQKQAVEAGEYMRVLLTRGTRGDSLTPNLISASAVFYKPMTDTSVTTPLPVITADRLALTASRLPDSTIRTMMAITMYRDLLKATKDAYLTVTRPEIRTASAPQKYDYFSAYYLTIIGGMIGLALTFLVKLFERMGIVKKLGLLEDGINPDDPTGAKAAKGAHT